MSAPLADLKGPVGPANFTRPKHKRTVTGFGPGEIKSVEASIPEPQRAAWRKFVSSAVPLARMAFYRADRKLGIDCMIDA